MLPATENRRWRYSAMARRPPVTPLSPAKFPSDVRCPNGPVTNKGQSSLRERYAALFTHFPENHAKVLHRAVVGNVVVDHEEITREPGQEPFYVVAIYTIAHGQIARADFVRDT